MFTTGTIISSIGLLAIIYTLIKPNKWLTRLGFLLFFAGAFLLILNLI